MATTVSKLSLSDDGASRAVLAAMDKARQLGVPMAIAVLDESGILKAFHRMDGSPLLSLQISQDKAFTALRGRSSQEIGQMMSKDPVMMAGMMKVTRITPFGGGLPIRIDQMVVGSIGVSGGSVEQDIACAEAGIAALALA